MHPTVWLVSELNKMLWLHRQSSVAGFLFLVAATEYLMEPTEARVLSWLLVHHGEEGMVWGAPRWQGQEAAACWHLSEPGSTERTGVGWAVIPKVHLTATHLF